VSKLYNRRFELDVVKMPFPDRILLDLKLGKQAFGYKAVQKALNRFIAELTYSNTSVF
jgi:hypothetical protein